MYTSLSIFLFMAWIVKIKKKLNWLKLPVRKFLGQNFTVSEKKVNDFLCEVCWAHFWIKMSKIKMHKLKKITLNKIVILIT